MRFSTDGTTYGSWVHYASSVPYTLPSGDGSKSVYVEFRNGAGAISAPAHHTITLDTTAPVITQAPVPSFYQGQLGSTAVPITISWAGADATSGISHYDLMESVDGGAFSLVASPAVAKATENLNPGHSYVFKVRAIDRARNVSGFTAGASFTLSAYQETASPITYSSGWTPQPLTGAYGGSVKYATVADADGHVPEGADGRHAFTSSSTCSEHPGTLGSTWTRSWSSGESERVDGRPAAGLPRLWLGGGPGVGRVWRPPS